MKKNIVLLLIISTFQFNLWAQTKPFPQHTDYSLHIKPNNYTQAELDKHCSDFYKVWKSKYIQSSCGLNKYFVSFDDSKTCVSEGQGYGMMIMPLMAGFEADAQSYFDGMYRYYKEHPSSINSNLMAWKQVSCVNQDGDDAASDGDIDIAYGLLLAHVQWGSNGEINYLQEAKTIIKAIMKDEVYHNTWTIKLGDWANSGSYLNSTRTSDFILDHFRVFSCATNNNDWDNVVDTCYSLIENIQSNYSETTGLLPDFIVSLNTNAKPASPNFLEGENDGAYSYNACRDPWRLTTDYLLFGDERAKTAVNNINIWLMNKCNSNPDNIKSGYKLDGTETATWNDAAFVGPFTVGAMTSNNQQWLNDLYDKLLTYKAADGNYYSNTIKLLNLIVISGNYWSPKCDELTTGFKYKNLKQNRIKYAINNNWLQISLPEPNMQISIINLNGKLMRTKFSKSNFATINISDLDKACYILKLEDIKNNKFVSDKFIIR